MLTGDFVGGGPALVIGAVGLLFGDGLVDFFDVFLDAGLFFFEFLLAIFAQQQIEQRVQLSDQVALPLDGIPQFTGEDKILSNVLAFDVRVYDPYAGLWADNLNSNATDAPLGVLSPGDPGYAFAWAELSLAL